MENIDYTPFKDRNEFLTWVSTNDGSNVARSCEIQLENFSGRAMDIVEDIEQKTRQIDIAKNKLRVRFVM